MGKGMPVEGHMLHCSPQCQRTRGRISLCCSKVEGWWGTSDLVSSIMGF